MKKSRLFILLIISFYFAACKPYDANEVNRQLLQGKWILTDANYPNKDSIEIDYSKEITYLIFKGDSCIEHLSNLRNETRYKFDVDDYTLKLFQDSTLIGQLDILALSGDSLILGGQSEWYRKYKKIK